MLIKFNNELPSAEEIEKFAVNTHDEQIRKIHQQLEEYALLIETEVNKLNYRKIYSRMLKCELSLSMITEINPNDTKATLSIRSDLFNIQSYFKEKIAKLIISNPQNIITAIYQEQQLAARNHSLIENGQVRIPPSSISDLIKPIDIAPLKQIADEILDVLFKMQNGLIGWFNKNKFKLNCFSPTAKEPKLVITSEKLPLEEWLKIIPAEFLSPRYGFNGFALCNEKKNIIAYEAHLPINLAIFKNIANTLDSAPPLTTVYKSEQLQLLTFANNELYRQSDGFTFSLTDIANIFKCEESKLLKLRKTSWKDIEIFATDHETAKKLADNIISSLKPLNRYYDPTYDIKIRETNSKSIVIIEKHVFNSFIKVLNLHNQQTQAEANKAAKP